MDDIDYDTRAPPIEKSLSTFRRKNYIQNQAAEFIKDKAGYVKKQTEERNRNFNETKDRLSKMRSELIKKGIDYNTTKQLVSSAAKNEFKQLKSLEKEIYPIVITLKTKSIKLK